MVVYSKSNLPPSAGIFMMKHWSMALSWGCLPRSSYGLPKSLLSGDTRLPLEVTTGYIVYQPSYASWGHNPPPMGTDYKKWTSNAMNPKQDWVSFGSQYLILCCSASDDQKHVDDVMKVCLFFIFFILFVWLRYVYAAPFFYFFKNWFQTPKNKDYILVWGKKSTLGSGAIAPRAFFSELTRVAKSQDDLDTDGETWMRSPGENDVSLSFFPTKFFKILWFNTWKYLTQNYVGAITYDTLKATHLSTGHLNWIEVGIRLGLEVGEPQQ